jgi:predicted esterase
MPVCAQVDSITAHKKNVTLSNSTTHKDSTHFIKAGMNKVTGSVKSRVDKHRAKKKADFIAMVEAKEEKEKVLQTRRDIQSRKMMEKIDPAQRPSTFTYALRENRNLKLDVWQPEDQRDDKACVIYVFGGGFFCGSRNDSLSISACRALTDKGFVAISIDYRLGLTDTKIDTLMLANITNPFLRSINWAVEDLSAAITYVCKHAEELNIDPKRIILTGASAGAITVLQTDYCRVNGYAPARDLPAEFTPMAVISYSGALFVENGKMKYTTPPAPTFLLHGTADRIVNYRSLRPSLKLSLKGSCKIANVMKNNNYQYWIYRFKDRGHEVNTYLPATIDEFTLFVDMIEEGRVTTCDATYEDMSLPQSPNVNKNIIDLYFK